MELVRVGLIPLRRKEKYISSRYSFLEQMERARRKNTYSLSSTRVNPAEPIRYSLSLFNFITILGIVLMDVKREQRRIDRRICVQHLEQTLSCIEKDIYIKFAYVYIDPASPSFMMSKMWRKLERIFEQGIKISFLL
jgi:hypothetical protein